MGNLPLTSTHPPASLSKLAAETYEQLIRETPDPDAMYDLATLVRDGINDFPDDLPLAVRLLDRASTDHDHPAATIELATLLHFGQPPLAPDPPRAALFYQRAIDRFDNPLAINYLAVLLVHGARGVPPDPARAIALFERAAEEYSHPAAIVNIAILLQTGVDGVCGGPARAVELYERVIESQEEVVQDHVIFSLGDIFRAVGDGQARHATRNGEAAQDVVTVFSDIVAMNNLAVLLTDGAEGVERNPVRAVELYERLVCRHQLSTAYYNFADLVDSGEGGIARTPWFAARLYERAMLSRWEVRSMVKLARMYREELGAKPKDLQRGRFLCEKALEMSDNAEALAELDLLRESGVESSGEFIF